MTCGATLRCVTWKTCPWRSARLLLGDQQDCLAPGLFGSDVVQSRLPALDFDQPQGRAGAACSRKKWREIASVARASKTDPTRWMYQTGVLLLSSNGGRGAGRRGGEG